MPMPLSRLLLSLSELPQYIAQRYGLSLERAEDILGRGFRQHSLSAISCRHDANLGIDLTTHVDFEDTEIYWEDNKVRCPGDFLVHANVHVSEQLLNDWVKLQLRNVSPTGLWPVEGGAHRINAIDSINSLVASTANVANSVIQPVVDQPIKKRRRMYEPGLKSWLTPQITIDTKPRQAADFAKEFYLHCQNLRPDLLEHLPKRQDKIEPVIERIIEATKAAIFSLKTQ